MCLITWVPANDFWSVAWPKPRADAGCRRTVTSWLRGTGISDDYQDYYYFLTGVGCNSKKIASQLALLVIRTLPLPPWCAASCGDTLSARGDVPEEIRKLVAGEE